MGNVYEAALKVYKKAEIAFIGSNDGEGYPNIKAVLITERAGDMGKTVIKTNTSSRHVQQLLHDGRGCLYFYDAASFQGVMLLGKYEVVTDDEKMPYWNEGDEIYYRKGMEDYCLLKFTAQKGRYYCSFNSEDFPL